MAKRKSKNKNFASKRAAEASAAQKKETVQSTIRTGVIALVGLAVLIVGIFSLTRFINNDQGEVEPAAVDGGSGTIETGSGTEPEPVEEDQVVDGQNGEVEPSGMLLETDRPLSDVAPNDRNGYYSAPPEMMIDTAKSYQALIVTDQGEMLIELFDDQAPITVNNFVFLATQGFYDDLIFHRVIENFMVQGGDPAGIGSGGPGYSFEDEFDPSLRFDRRGLLAMANSGPGTNGSQFFITHVPTDWLNDAHTIFGELISGDDTLGAIPISGQPNSPAQLIRIDIYEN